MLFNSICFDPKTTIRPTLNLCWSGCRNWYWKIEKSAQISKLLKKSACLFFLFFLLQQMLSHDYNIPHSVGARSIPLLFCLLFLYLDQGLTRFYLLLEIGHCLFMLFLKLLFCSLYRVSQFSFEGLRLLWRFSSYLHDLIRHLVLWFNHLENCFEINISQTNIVPK